MVLVMARLTIAQSPLVALFLHSPEDYVAHDRGARRIDFVLRNIKILYVRTFSSSIHDAHLAW